ncbi:transcriptional regulator GcvA [Zavarzinia compransoris]|uniref:transcriptional regulator GcvA n=1 Tax=Zavarzinia marina TaxID=2911065 RepID=UPI001F391157|nr:transcriptional regulator GcvA [Zavarzinia marina]MCF4165546.1 transcriptional regulator GcvA [Zavarzinia marina]
MDRLPLNALRAFEAAARHLSLTRAAEELHLTHGAISHQVRALEALLGAALFNRRGRGVVLTEAGQHLAGVLTGSFAQINQAMNTVRRQSNDTLTISVLTSFAARWLVPRLERFHEAHPEVVLSMRTGRELADLRRDGVDLAIRSGRGNYPGLDVRFLMAEDLFAVASPQLAGGLPETPADLRRYLLLRDSFDDWAMWCRAAGFDFTSLRFGTVFQDSAVLLDAAARGGGIALARSALVAPDLESGRLVRLFDVQVPDLFSYWTVTLPERADEPAIAHFRDWLHHEAALFVAESGLGVTLNQGAATGA